MAQEVRRRGGATKVDVFNEQVSGDDCFFTRGAAKHCGIVADARDERGRWGMGRRGDGVVLRRLRVSRLRVCPSPAYGVC